MKALKVCCVLSPLLAAAGLKCRVDARCLKATLRDVGFGGLALVRVDTFRSFYCLLIMRRSRVHVLWTVCFPYSLDKEMTALHLLLVSFIFFLPCFLGMHACSN